MKENEFSMSERELHAAARSCLEEGKDLTLVPYGKFARKVRKILREVFDVEPKWIVDNYAARTEENGGEAICSLDDLPDDAEGTRFLLCSEWDAVRVELSLKLRSRFPKADIVRIQDLSPVLQKSYARPDKIHLDFLGIGFPKCMTSSAYAALRQNPAIFLSPTKENFLLSWNIHEGAHEAMAACFPLQETEGKLVGDIETSYGFFPERVAAYHGPHLKLLFFLREPAAALYSWFKMEMREVWSSYAVSLVKKYGKVCPEMFDEYAETRKWLFCYGAALDRYLEYYDRRNMHIVISEEMVRNPRREMDTLQAFLGLPEGKRIPVDVLPRVNEGPLVVADGKSAESRYRRIAEGPANRSFSVDGEAHRSQEREDPTLVPYREPMFPTTRTRLEQFFRPQVQRVEGILGRSLKGQWY